MKHLTSTTAVTLGDSAEFDVRSGEDDLGNAFSAVGISQRGVGLSLYSDDAEAFERLAAYCTNAANEILDLQAAQRAGAA